MRSHVLSIVAAASGVIAQAEYTATGTADVYAAQATAKSLSPTSNVKGKVFDRVAIIWLENTDYDLAVGDPNLASLAERGIKLENYFAVTHPSQPNYVASVGGDYFGMDDDALLSIDANISSIVDLLEDKGISWGEYQEDMPYSGFEGKAWVNQKTGANDYVRKHNPEIIYDSVTVSPDRAAQTKNLTMFYEDLEAGTLPQWMFITPNMTSDGHDTSVTVAGTWTRTFLEPLLKDTRFMNNTLVIITFDENSSYAIQNRVLAILIGDAVPSELVGTTDSNFYNHYSEIATVSANWDLHTLGRWDIGANVFSFVANVTGDPVRAWNGSVPLDAMFYNQSYDGVFNDASSNPVYPKPDLNLTSPSGRTVLPSIADTWVDSDHPDYYTGQIETPDGLNPPAGYGSGGFVA